MASFTVRRAEPESRPASSAMASSRPAAEPSRAAASRAAPAVPAPHQVEGGVQAHLHIPEHVVQGGPQPPAGQLLPRQQLAHVAEIEVGGPLALEAQHRGAEGGRRAGHHGGPAVRPVPRPAGGGDGHRPPPPRPPPGCCISSMSSISRPRGSSQPRPGGSRPGGAAGPAARRAHDPPHRWFLRLRGVEGRRAPLHPGQGAAEQHAALASGPAARWRRGRGRTRRSSPAPPGGPPGRPGPPPRRTGPPALASRRQQEPPQPQGPRQLLGGHGVPGDAGDGHHDEHRRGDDLGLHRRAAHHQAADDGHGLADGLGQAQARLLEDLKGQQQHDHLKGGAEGHVLLGGDDGQGQAGGDHLLVEGDHGHVEGGEQAG